MQGKILSEKNSKKFEEALCAECHSKLVAFCERITKLEESDKFLDRMKAKKEIIKFPVLYKTLCPKCTNKFKKLITG